MSLPTELTQVIKNAQDAVEKHPYHDLNLGYRQAIWAALGPSLKTSQRGGNNAGLKRRAFLAILTTRYVLPIWERVRPEDHILQDLLAEAEQVLTGTVDKETAWNDRDRFWVYFVDMGNEDEKKQIISGVGFAAVHALTVALQDESFDPSNINYNLTDADIDPDEMDSSFFAASTYANGPVSEPDSDAEKRRDFWEWWSTRPFLLPGMLLLKERIVMLDSSV